MKTKKTRRKERRDPRPNPKRSSPPPDTDQEAPKAGVKGRVQAITLGENGCLVMSGPMRYQVGAAVPGDLIRMTPLRERGDPIPARLAEVIEPSSDRIQPPCNLIGRCGGCTFQAMAYEAQLSAKHKALQRALESLCEGSLIGPPKGLSSPVGYRTRLLMQATPKSPKGNKGIRLGFFERGTTQLVDTAGCPVQHPLTLATLAMVKQVLTHTPMAATDHTSARGWLHGLNIRVDPPSGASEVTLIGRHDKLPGLDHIAQRIKALPGVSGVHLAINPERTSYLYGDRFALLAGRKRTAFTLGGEAFHLSPGAFFQTCAEGAELLAQTVLAMLPEKMMALADLYGGVGVFARLSADRWQRAIVVESNPHAIDDLKSWLRHSHTRKITISSGRVEQNIGHVMESTPDVILLDPPRGGCHHKVISTLGDHKPPVIVYVACGIDSLVRDGAALIGHGYRVQEVASVDMFPHTPHLETIVKFVLPPSA